MIKVYVKKDDVWRRIYNTENIALTYEIGGRVPSFSFSLPDRNFLFSIFNTESPYAGFLKKGNQVKIVKDDLTIAKGYIDKPDWQYPEQLVTVQCKGTLAKLQEDNFQGTDWSYESGNFSLSIPGSRYVDMSSYNATAVWEIKVNGKFFWSYEWNAVEQKIIITDNSTGTISGKYLAAVSPHDFFASLLSGYDIALVPLIHGTDDYVFSALNLASGAELDGIDEELNGTGEIITRPIDLGKYTTGFGTAIFNINGLTSAFIRGGDKRNTTISNPWKEITSETNLNSIFGRFVRFIQFKLIINEGEGENSVTINLTGNAPNIEKIKFENENKFNALQRLAECYQCYLFEDRFGTLRMEHKETTEDWEDTLDYLKFTGMRVEGNYSPKRVNVNGLEQKFTWLTGDMAGTEYTIKHKGAVEFEGDDLTGEVTIENKYAWSESILQNIGLCYQPPLTKIRINTNKEWELGDLVKVQTNYLEAEDFVSLMRFVDVEDTTAPFVDIEDTEIPFISNILLEATAIYRVAAKIYRDEITWDYELEEVHRLPFKFYNLYEYDFSSEYNYYDDIIVPTEPDAVYVWDGEDWTTPDYDYNPDTGEVFIPNIIIPEIETPDVPIIPGELIPENPIVVYSPQQTPQPNYNPYTPDGINQYRWFWDVWNCDYVLDETIGEKQWWGYYPYINDSNYGRRHFASKGYPVYVNDSGQPLFTQSSYAISGYKKIGDNIYYHLGFNAVKLTEGFIGRPYYMRGFYSSNYDKNWANILSEVRNQGKAIQFRKSPTGGTLKIDGLYFRVYKSDGTLPLKSEGGFSLKLKAYAITTPISADGIFTWSEVNNFSKSYLFDITVNVSFGSGSSPLFNTVISAIGDDQYPIIESLINGDIPWYGLLFEPQWVTNYYVEETSKYLGRIYFALNNEIDGVLEANGIMRWKAGYGVTNDFYIESGTETTGWPDKPEYFFKLWRGFTFETRAKWILNKLDTTGAWHFYYFHDFSDGYKKRDLELYLVTDWPEDVIKVYAGDDYYDSISIADINSGEFYTCRIVLLSIMRFKNIYDGDGITNWESGNLISFKDEANIEYFKDVSESKVSFKGDPNFTGYSAIYINNQLVREGTLDDNFCTSYTTYEAKYQKNSSLDIEVDCLIEGLIYYDYIKMTDKAMDVDVIYSDGEPIYVDLEHIILKP